MIKSSPVPPHELQVQALIGETTTSSLRLLATTRSYSSHTGRSVSPVGAVIPANYSARAAPGNSVTSVTRVTR